jgi:DNA-directed RNA polymerase subunit E"
MAKELACRICKYITTEKVCSGCKGTDLSPDWSGVVLIVKPKESRIARTMFGKAAEDLKPGKYAIKVT